MLQLKRLRELTDLSQRDVAALINKTPQAYHQYEQGKREPDLATLIKLADVFEVSVDTLLNHTPITQPGHIFNIMPDEEQLLKKYRDLDSNRRNSLHDYMQFLHSQQLAEQVKKDQAV